MEKQRSEQNEPVTYLTKPERRRRWTVAEKTEIVRRSIAPGQRASAIAREYGVSLSLLSRWRRLYDQGGLHVLSDERSAAPSSNLEEAIAHIRKLEQLLGRMTLENEMLKEEIGFFENEGGPTTG